MGKNQRYNNHKIAKHEAALSFSTFFRGRPQPLVVWMHEEERTFLLPGDTAGNLEVTSDAALLVTSPEGRTEEYSI